MLYQCLETFGCYLFAARGSCIDIINTDDFSLESTWKCPRVCTKSVEPNLETRELERQSEKTTPNTNSKSASPPIKKRKLSTPEDCEIIEGSKNSKGSEGNNSKNGSHLNEIPVVSILTATNNGKYVIAVTGEDKSIRVLEVIFDGKTCNLIQRSQRPMPKRPCAIALTDDNKTIICADKFGDVYSIPLLQSTPSTNNLSTSSPGNTVEPFVPAANEFTIHSQRNRRALESQKKQTKQPSQRSELNFDHKLLLGHVSMLTDVKLVSLSGRNYIITSDRDEHIRISRGIPQTHVIENFCLGHSEFVSRLCIPETRPMILVSGGGEDDLFVWDWSSGSLLSKTNLAEYVRNVKKKLDLIAGDETNDYPVKLAVSGIFHIHTISDDKPVDLIVVNCESTPALFTFILSPQNKLQYTETIWTSGNILAMCATSGREATAARLLVSVDNYHKLGSSTEPRNPESSNLTALNSFELHGTKLTSLPMNFKVPRDNLEEANNFLPSNLKNLLYGIENLRKRDDNFE